MILKHSNRIWNNNSSFTFFFFFILFISLSLAEKVASVLGCVVMISMENYRIGSDDGNDIGTIDFNSLAKDIQVCYPFLCAAGTKMVYSLIQ